jgi:hypothetical protein
MPLRVADEEDRARRHLRDRHGEPAREVRVAQMLRTVEPHLDADHRQREHEGHEQREGGARPPHPAHSRSGSRASARRRTANPQTA